MAFERFTKTGRGFKPKVSIWSRGQIGFNLGAVNAFGLESFQYVIFFYDRERGRIGFEFTNDEKEEGANKLKFRRTGASASSKAFLDYYGINYKKTTKYDVHQDKESSLLVLELGTGEVEDDSEPEPEED